jgi:hypothetical protein
MALTWSGRRKALYTSVVSLLAFLVAIFVYQSFFTAPPLCTDGKQNGDEHGVDCGGSCSLVCPAEARPPVVSWARSFEAAPGSYTAAAYIQNNNPGAGARRVAYSFQLFDADNILVVERDGVADLPPAATIPIVETNIAVGNTTPVRTFFAFSQTPVWVRAGQQPVLSSTNQVLSSDASRLEAVAHNDSLVPVHAQLTAVLFDSQGVARAASKSAVTIAPRGQVPIVFTWGEPAHNIVRAEITILPLLQ